MGGIASKEPPQRAVLFATEGTLIDAYALRMHLGPSLAFCPLLPTQLLEESIYPCQRCADLLSALQDQNIAVVALSSIRVTSTLVRMLKLAEVFRYVDYVIGADCVKPTDSGLPFSQLVRNSHIPLSRCTLIADEAANRKVRRKNDLEAILEVDGPHQVNKQLLTYLIEDILAA